jgi:hypothetical protein
MGGDDSKDNLIRLSIEDHYMAHILLSESFQKGEPWRRTNLASAIFIKKEIDNWEKMLEYRESLLGEGNPNYGNNWSDEKKKEQSEKIHKLWSDLENRKKIMKPKGDTSRMGRHDKRAEKNPFYNKTHTDETRKKLSELRMGKKPSNIRMVSIDGNIYNGLKEASSFTGIKETTIWHRINSKNKKYENYKYIG